MLHTPPKARSSDLLFLCCFFMYCPLHACKSHRTTRVVLSSSSQLYVKLHSDEFAAAQFTNHLTRILSSTSSRASSFASLNASSWPRASKHTNFFGPFPLPRCAFSFANGMRLELFSSSSSASLSVFFVFFACLRWLALPACLLALSESLITARAFSFQPIPNFEQLQHCW